MDRVPAGGERLEVRRFLRAPRNEVFLAWTDPERMKHWFAPSPRVTPTAEVDLKPGGQYRIRMASPDGTLYTTSGVYQEIVPDERLVFTWGWEGPEREETLVTVEFRDSRGGTELTLVHERFSTPESRDRHAEGWDGCLAQLETMVSAPDTEPRPRT